MKAELQDTQQKLGEALEELNTARGRVGSEGDLLGSEVESLTQEIEDLRCRYEEADDLAHRKQWELDQLRNLCELDTLRAKESLREELQAAHVQELKVRDDFIQMLNAKVSEKEGQASKGACAVAKQVLTVPTTTPDKDEESAETKQDVVDGGSAKVTRKVTLPSLPRFSGEKLEDGAFERWNRKLLRHAELEKWTEREKLLQLELHLTNRAEQLYEVLPAGDKTDFPKAVEALGKRLQPVKSEALLSAQLLHRIRVKGDSAYCINTAQVLKQVYLIEQRTHIVALAEPHAQETRTALMP